MKPKIRERAGTPKLGTLCVCVCVYLCVGARGDVDKNPEGNQATDLDAKMVGFTLITMLLL
jgi:hypothetical protein